MVFKTMKHPKATNHKTPVSMETKAQESTLKEECQNEFGERISSDCLANADKVSETDAQLEPPHAPESARTLQ